MAQFNDAAILALRDRLSSADLGLHRLYRDREENDGPGLTKRLFAALTMPRNGEAWFLLKERELALVADALERAWGMLEECAEAEGCEGDHEGTAQRRRDAQAMRDLLEVLQA